jgi:hypothetical protein
MAGLRLIHLYHTSVPASSAVERRRWLLLIHQLPKDPAYLRVKIGRRLAGVGAVALKNSVYVLPRTEGAAEDLHWLRREILEGGGEATVAEAELIDGLTDEEVEARFRAASDADYLELAREARELGASVKPRRGRALRDDERATLLASVVRLERRMAELATTDFFGASLRETAAGLLRELRTRAEPPTTEADPEPPAPPRHRTWVTRTGIHVDRIASAWLIRRSIDPEASFKYVPPKGYVPLPGELRFDMFEAEYSHEGDRCTFETLMERFGLAEPGLRGVAEVVHDIDLKESKFDRPETPGVAACIAGLCRAERDDDERLRRGSVLFESLLSHFATQKAERPTRP